MDIAQIIFIVIGIFTIISGITKLGFNRRKAQRVINLIGEFPTQIFYIVTGIALIVIAFVVDLS